MKYIYTLVIILINLNAFSQNCNIGNDSTSNEFVDQGTFGANYLLGVKYTLEQEGTLKAVNLIGNNTGAGVRMAVYDDNGGVPNNLIASSASSTVGDGLTSLPVTPVLLPAGDYWVMAVYASDGNHSDKNLNATGNVVYYQSLDFSDPIPTNTSNFLSYTGRDYLYSLSIDCGNTLPTDICNIGNETSTNDFVDGQFSANYLLGVKYSLSQEGTLNAIKLIGNDSGSGVQMAVYDDNGGVPNNLIAYSVPSIVGDGLTSLPVTPVLLPAGDYWIMAVYASDGNHTNVNRNAFGNVVFYQSLTYGDPLPTNASNFISYTDRDYLYSLSIDCGNTLPAAELTINGLTGNNKVYDNTTTALASGIATLVGVETGDDVFLGGSPVFTYESANVGTNISINTTGYTISGADADKYTLVQPTLSGDIIAKELSIIGLIGSDKVYDDTTMASASGTATLSGVEPGDDVFLGGSPGFTFASSNVGTDINIITIGYTISGTDSGNYMLLQPILSGEISAAELNIFGLSGNNKEYDGTTAATASGIATLSGVIGADDVILGGSPVFTFASPEVGTGITITTSGYTISGTDSGNYVLTQPILSGDITSNLNNSDYALKNQIKLYPNPTKGDVILNTGSISNTSIKVFNLSGQVILEEKNFNSIFKFNINESAGLYLVQITSPKGQTAYLKIMKN